MEWDDNLIKVTGIISGIILFGFLVWWSLKFEKERENQEKEDERVNQEKERVKQEKVWEAKKAQKLSERRASKSEAWRNNKKKAKADSKEQEAGKRVFKLNPGEVFLIFIEPSFATIYTEPVFFTKFNSGKTIFGEENYGIGVIGNINIHKDIYIAKWFSSYEEVIAVIISFIQKFPAGKGRTHLLKIKVRNGSEIIGGSSNYKIIRLNEDFIDLIQKRF